jgi:hypothetical protein
MTCSIENASLLQVLEELGGRTGVAFVAAQSIGDDRVSLEVVDVLFDEGLRRLLRSYDAFLYYSASDEAVSSLRAVWIYAKGAGTALQPVPQETEAAVAELRERLGDADPRVREQAYMALISRPDDASRELVLNALRGSTETDEDLRQRLLLGTIHQGMDVPRDLLADLALADGSELLRLLALDALADDPTVGDVAAAAVNDPSPMVRQRAQEILGAMAAANRSEPPQPF